MPKLIIGIVAIMFLQIGFIAYMDVEQQEVAFDGLSTGTVAVRDGYIINDPVDEYGPLEIDTFQFNNGIATDRSIRPPEYTPAKSSTARQPKNTAARTFYPIENNAGRGSLKVIVTDPYANKKSDEAKAFRDREPSKSANEPRQRSVIARVIKKPFDWLKAVAAKL